MGDPDVDVREARLSLARVLVARAAAPEDLDEAESLLLRALATAGPGGPARWELLAELADVARGRGQVQGEVDRLVEAVVAAPPEAAAALPELADRVLGLIERDTAGGGLVEGLPTEVAAELWAAAHDPGRPDVVVQLAARLALARGHVSAAGEVSRQRQTVVASTAQDLQAVGVVASVIELLAVGDVEGADAQLAGVRHLSTEPSVVLAEALLLYARGELQAALAQAESWAGVGDLGVVAVIAQLSQAVAERERAKKCYKAARTAATRAARHDPSSGEPVLLRAQVLLETGVDLDLGRELLGTALARLGDPAPLPWWRIQEQARTDDRYRYFRVEVAAALGQREQVLRHCEAFGAVLTDYAQDARLRELWAAVVDEPAEVAGLLRAAAADHRQAEDLAAAVRCLRSAYGIEPGPSSGLELADGLWSSSFGAPDAEAEKFVEEGLGLMGSLEGQHPPEGVAQAGLMWGLLLARADTLASSDRVVRPDQRWRALPHLLLATQLEPDAPYAWAHLAWTCVDADLRWPAAWAARRAIEIRPDDDWLRETCLVSEINWAGVIPERLREWLRDAPEDVVTPGWVAAVTAYDRLLHRRPGEAADLVELMDFDAWWAREIRVLSLALGRSLDEASDHVWKLVDEAETLGQLLDAAWWSLVVDPDHSAVLAERAAARGDRRAGTELQWSAIELMTADAQRGADRLGDALQRTCRPSRLAEEGCVRFPLLAAAHPDQPQLLTLLDALSALAAERRRGLDPAPALSAEIDSQEAWCDDADLGGLVRHLLERASGSPSGGPLAEVPWLPGATTVAAAWRALDAMDSSD